MVLRGVGLRLGAFNAGFGGARTSDLLRAAEELCVVWSPRMVVLHCGGNDFDFRPCCSVGGEGSWVERLAAASASNLEALVAMLAEQLGVEVPVVYVAGPAGPTETAEKARFRQLLVARLRKLAQEAEQFHVVDLTALGPQLAAMGAAAAAGGGDGAGFDALEGAAKGAAAEAGQPYCVDRLHLTAAGHRACKPLLMCLCLCES